MGIVLSLKQGDKIEISGQASLIENKSGVFDVAGYQFDYPPSWKTEDLGSTNGDTLIQFRNSEDVIVMNLACPSVDLAYELWEVKESDERNFELLVKYKYLVPLASEDVSSAFIIDMVGGEYDCAIYAQDVENSLGVLKGVYESVRVSA